jgi:hypothetical protein
VANATGCCCCCCCCSYYSSILTTHCLLPPPLNTSHDLLYLGYRQPLAPLHNSSARSSQRERPTYLQHSTAQHSTAQHSTLPSSAPRSSPTLLDYRPLPHYSTATSPTSSTNQPAGPISPIARALPRPRCISALAASHTPHYFCSRLSLCQGTRLQAPSVCVCGSGTLHFSCCYCCYSTAACCRCYHRAAAAAHPPQLLSEPCRRELPFRPPSLSPM